MNHGTWNVGGVKHVDGVKHSMACTCRYVSYNLPTTGKASWRLYVCLGTATEQVEPKGSRFKARAKERCWKLEVKHTSVRFST